MTMLKKFYDRVVGEPAFGFLQMPDGQIVDCKESLVVSGSDCFDVFPGSYNPLHAGHLEIFAAIKNPNKAFEMSISRVDKPDMSYEELERRIKQFEWKSPVLVLRYARFIDKAGVLWPYNVKFHVGFDTAQRIMDQHRLAEIQGMRCAFCVYPRLMPKPGGDKVCGLDDLMGSIFNAEGERCPRPSNFEAGVTLTESVHGISSTAIRNGAK